MRDILRTIKRCVDDYGTEWRTTHYTDRFLPSTLLKYSGSVFPQSPEPIVVEKDESLWKEAWKEERAAFADMDRNCNACAHLHRHKTSRKEQIAGFSKGSCDSGNKRVELIPYSSEDGVFYFSPVDWMGMPCFVNRYHQDIVK